MPPEVMIKSLGIKTPNGRMVIVNEMLRRCPLYINNFETLADLIIMDMQKYDVILGMTWMSAVKRFYSPIGIKIE